MMPTKLSYCLILHMLGGGFPFACRTRTSACIGYSDYSFFVLSLALIFHFQARKAPPLHLLYQVSTNV